MSRRARQVTLAASASPEASTPPDRDYAELVGGPLGDSLLDITGWTADEVQISVALMTELGQFGPGGRALYDPRSGALGRFGWKRRYLLTSGCMMVVFSGFGQNAGSPVDVGS